MDIELCQLCHIRESGDNRCSNPKCKKPFCSDCDAKLTKEICPFCTKQFIEKRDPLHKEELGLYLGIICFLCLMFLKTDISEDLRLDMELLFS